MKIAGEINFTEQETGDQAYIAVRHDSSCVALCVSLRQDGDVEVTMSKAEAQSAD